MLTVIDEIGARFSLGDFPAAPAPALEPGELLLLLTDGILEAHGPDGKLFVMKRVFDVVRAHHEGTARRIVDALYLTVRRFCGPQSQLDDMTTVVIKAPPARSPASAS